MSNGEAMDNRRFLKHFLANERLLKSYLLAATGNTHEAEDLLQEVAVVLWEKFELFDESRPFRAWALGIARLETLKRKQRKARGRNFLSPETLRLLEDTAVENAREAEVRRTYLAECLRRLTEKARKVVRMKYLEALSVAKVAERLGKSIGAIEMILVRARRALRDCIERRLRNATEAS